jgi:hypothetical protein
MKRSVTSMQLLEAQTKIEQQIGLPIDVLRVIFSKSRSNDMIIQIKVINDIFQKLLAISCNFIEPISGISIYKEITKLQTVEIDTSDNFLAADSLENCTNQLDSIKLSFAKLCFTDIIDRLNLTILSIDNTLLQQEQRYKKDMEQLPKTHYPY